MSCVFGLFLAPNSSLAVPASSDDSDREPALASFVAKTNTIIVLRMMFYRPCPCRILAVFGQGKKAISSQISRRMPIFASCDWFTPRYDVACVHMHVHNYYKISIKITLFCNSRYPMQLFLSAEYTIRSYFGGNMYYVLAGSSVS